MVTSSVYDMKTKTTACETRYFISSLPVDPTRALKAIRAHWGIEAMHWILDMDFDEPFLYGSAYYGVAQRAFQQFRNNCKYVDSHDMCFSNQLMQLQK